LHKIKDKNEELAKKEKEPQIFAD